MATPPPARGSGVTTLAGRLERSGASALVTALGVVSGAWWARPVPLPVLLVGASVALVAWRRAIRHPDVRTILASALLVALGAALLASSLGHRAWSGARPVAPAPYDGVVALRTDPAPVGRGVVATAELRTGPRAGALVELRAFGPPARRLTARLAGEHVAVRGDLRPPPAAIAPRLASRHVVGRLDVSLATDWAQGDALARSANRVRRVVAEGSRTLGPTERALLQGMVLGDDRELPGDVRDQFRAAGLSHLTAVSGQNVAFLLALASPVLGRLRPWWRWGATVSLILWFALVTRFEPSVLRATAMAAITVTAATLGRPAGTLRVLGLAVGAVVLADPLLVHAVGFWLSVTATAGIVLLARPLGDRLPGPRPIAAALGVTLAAQVGVAPVSLAVFGSVPLASVPANLLAAPAAGPVMVAGLPATLVAAAAPDGLASAVQVPSLLLVRWVALVARAGAAAPLPSAGAVPVVVLAAAVVLVLRRPPREPL